MTEETLFENARNAHAREDYLAALLGFLKLRERKLDLVHSWDVGGGPTRVRLRDLDFDTVKEIGTLASNGRFSTYSLHPVPGIAASLEGASFRNFRFLKHREAPGVVLLDRHTNRGAISVFTFQRTGSRLSLSKVGELTPPIDRGEVLDIDYKKRKIYVTTSDCEVHRFDEITLSLERTFRTKSVIGQLNTGGPPPHNDPEWMMNDRLLAVLVNGGLMRCDLFGGNFKEGPVFGEGTVYADTFIGDADNKGTPGIIGCSREGKVHIYDWRLLQLKYAFSSPDEFNTVYCDDIDGDGVMEILVGAKSNRIYALAVGADRDLQVKWIYETEHSVSDIWVGDVQPTDKRLVVGLGNGKLQVFKVHTAQAINRGISDAHSEIRSRISGDELQRLLSVSARPEVVRFGLDELTPDMSSTQILRFLRQIEERGAYGPMLQVLGKLKSYFAKFPSQPDLVAYVISFLRKLFDRHPDLPTCEQICMALDDLLKSGSGVSEELLRLSEHFSHERLRRNVFRSQAGKFIEDLSFSGNSVDASRELELLKSVGVDLLRSYAVDEGVTFVASTNQTGNILFTTRGRRFGIVTQTFERELFTAVFTDNEIHCCAAGAPGYSCIVCHGPVAELYNSHAKVECVRTYDASVTCVDAVAFDKSLYWVVGLASGDAVLETLDGTTRRFRLSEIPVKIAFQAHAGRLAMSILTARGTLHCCRDAIASLRGTKHNATRAVAFPADFCIDCSPNVLDWVPVNPLGKGVSFVILSPDAAFTVESVEERFRSFRILGNYSLTCIALSAYLGGQGYEVIAGTRSRSVLFASLDGTVRKEVFLPDVPTALHVLTRSTSGPQLVVGFAQGTLSSYQIVTERYVRELEKRCNAGASYTRMWNAHTLGEKIVLVVLSAGKRPDLPGISAALDRRLAILIPKELIVQSVKSLEQSVIILGEVNNGSVYYHFVGDGYESWIHAHHEVLEVVRAQREGLTDVIRLTDVPRLDTELKAAGEIAWLSEFLLIEPKKWSDLVRISDILCRRNGAAPDERASLRRAYVAALCASSGAILGNEVSVERDVPVYLSAFEVEMPGVKFQGFDCMLAVVLSTSESIDLSATLAWIKRCSKWSIVLILTSHNAPIIRNALKREMFSIAVLDDQDVKCIVLAPAPRDRLLDVIIGQVNITALSPFQTAGPVSEMFYGREDECQRIVNAMMRRGAKSYAVIGPRRIGKTSLLWRVNRDLERRKEFETLFLDVSPYGRDKWEWCNAILGRLKIQEEIHESRHFISKIRAYCETKKCTLALFLDEVDALLTLDREGDRTFANTLRALLNEGNIKLAIAGYRELYFAMYDADSALFNLLEKAQLSSLDQRNAVQLIEEPLQNMFRIERMDVLYILEKTACYPNFIQFCCSKLLEDPSVATTRTITRADITRVITSPELYEHMISVYVQNLDAQCKVLLYLMVAYYDPRLRKIVTDPKAYASSFKSKYAHAREKYELGDRFAPYDLHRLLELHNVDLTQQQLERLMKKLLLASIVQHEVKSKQYSFILPDLPAILSQHVEVELTAVNLLERIEDLFIHDEDL